MNLPPAAKRSIALISTGGTIEKTYDELAGVLENRVNVLDLVLSQLQLRGVEVRRVALMNKDSLEMTEADHAQIAETALYLSKEHDGIVITHGTDRLEFTGERIAALRPELPVPVVLTGAMRPYILRTTDAVQNVTEALLAVQLVPPGVYVAMHDRVLRFPGVTKDKEAGAFVMRGERPGPAEVDPAIAPD